MLQPSDEFIVDGCTYVKTYQIGYHYVPELTRNAVNLVTGYMANFKHSQEVYIVRTKRIDE